MSETDSGDTEGTPEEEPRDDIWKGDLLDRRIEAEQLIAYIESVAASPNPREDKQAYTIAVDAEYGEGKTFFLRRLAETLKSDHPVAFVDAWADDLSDEPLTALAATLQDALAPIADNEQIQDQIKSFIRKSGKVAKIAASGLLRRALALVITETAVGLLQEALEDSGIEANALDKHPAQDVASGAASDAIGEAEEKPPLALMETRVNEFNAGKAAVDEMKESLATIVASLADHRLSKPIIIVIDELDRCRPTYAVKLLGEIKHLFDVQGLVFIMALNREQLGHSIAGSYGPGFNGLAYLRRFIDRQYQLATPSLKKLSEYLCRSAGLPGDRFEYPTIGRNDSKPTGVHHSELIAEYTLAYGLGARDLYQVIDMVRTSVALTDRGLHLAFLLPLIIGRIKGLPEGELPVIVRTSSWTFRIGRDYWNNETNDIPIDTLARQYLDAMHYSYEELKQAVNVDPRPYGFNAVSQSRDIYQSRDINAVEQPLSAVESYPRLVNAVGRFTAPVPKAD